MQVPDSRVLPETPAALGPRAVSLPTVDIRTRLNERAIRGWIESSRRVARVVVLLSSDLIAGLAGVWLTVNTWSVVSDGGRRPLPDEVPLVAMVFCLMPLALRATGAYAGGRARVDLVRLAAGVAIAALFGWLQAQLFGREVPERPNKTAYVYAFVLITAVAWALRLVLDRAVAAAHRAGVLQRRILVVGTARQADDVARRAAQTDGCEFSVVGRIEPPGEVAPGAVATAAPGSLVPCLGGVEDLDQALSRTRADGVVVAANLSYSWHAALAERCFGNGATLSVLSPDLEHAPGHHVEVRKTTLGTLFQVRPLRLDVPQMALKRAMDLALSGLGLVLLSPLLALIAAAIKVDSRGPVLFSQVRVGVGGRPFHMVKFRTMHVGADAQKRRLAHMNETGDPRLFKIRNDPRVTRVGRLLRRTSLDELPQLVNVLRGDMSLVGPRPFFPEDVATYDRHHFERLHVLPGITGLWQVSGRSDVLDFEEVVRLDREYIRSWSLLRDVSILVKTIPTLFGRGAY
jgi:exopolysaccharide biosynthesis polyprenyl glycosylphosphotransferase